MTLAMPDNSSGSYNYSPSPSSRYSDRDACRFKAEREKPGASWETSPRRLESLSSNGSTSASSYWRPSTVNLVICFNFNTKL
jgi:hypothetical protein